MTTDEFDRELRHFFYILNEFFEKYKNLTNTPKQLKTFTSVEYNKMKETAQELIRISHGIVCYIAEPENKPKLNADEILPILEKKILDCYTNRLRNLDSKTLFFNTSLRSLFLSDLLAQIIVNESSKSQAQILEPQAMDSILAVGQYAFTTLLGSAQSFTEKNQIKPPFSYLKWEFPRQKEDCTNKLDNIINHTSKLFETHINNLNNCIESYKKQSESRHTGFFDDIRGDIFLRRYYKKISALSSFLTTRIDEMRQESKNILLKFEQIFSSDFEDYPYDEYLTTAKQLFNKNITSLLQLKKLNILSLLTTQEQFIEAHEKAWTNSKLRPSCIKIVSKTAGHNGGLIKQIKSQISEVRQRIMLLSPALEHNFDDTADVGHLEGSHTFRRYSS